MLTKNCVETATLCRGSFTLPVSVGEADDASAVAFRQMLVSSHRIRATVIVFTIWAAREGAHAAPLLQVAAIRGLMV